MKNENDTNKLNRIASGEISLDDVADVLSLTIKDDYSTKIILFLCMLSAYTEDSQLNVTLNATSSAGKTYLTSQVASLFPKIDKIEKSGASATSFFYGDGEIDQETKTKTISVERKIMIFYEMPDPRLQEKLRALLSHDDKELYYSFTNKDKGKNKTEQIVIRGYAATIFCSANLRLDEQESTRAILLSPETTAEKIRQGISLQAERSADANKFKSQYAFHPKKIALMERINAIREENVQHIIILDHKAIQDRFVKTIGPMKPRHQRDIDHLMQLIKAIALLNVWSRRDTNGNIVANSDDIDRGFDLWSGIFESQNLNVSPVVLAFYKDYIVPPYINKFADAKKNNKELWKSMKAQNIGLTSQEISNYYFDELGSALNGDQLRKQYLFQL